MYAHYTNDKAALADTRKHGVYEPLNVLQAAAATITIITTTAASADFQSLITIPLQPRPILPPQPVDAIIHLHRGVSRDTTM